MSARVRCQKQRHKSGGLWPYDNDHQVQLTVSLIRVYRYKVFSPEHGAFVDTEIPVYATLEKIASLKAQSISGAYLEVDESHLSSGGFYHPSSMKQ
jgi:hypothetical protein